MHYDATASAATDSPRVDWNLDTRTPNALEDIPAEDHDPHAEGMSPQPGSNEDIYRPH